MSTDLITYLNYMSTWDTESDKNIDAIISEQVAFIHVGSFDPTKAIDAEFKNLHDSACAVRDLTIASDASQMAADAAAIGSLWSFGMGMAVFGALEAAAIVDKAVISKKSDQLNAKLESADTDIADAIGPKVKKYVHLFKENNALIESKSKKGMNSPTARSILFQFMAKVLHFSGKLDAVTFRQYANSARVVYQSKEIESVYNALDKLNMSSKNDNDIKAFMNTLVGWSNGHMPKMVVPIVQSLCLFYMKDKLNIPENKLSDIAKEQGMEVEELTPFEMMDAWGKFGSYIVFISSVVDIILNVLDISKVVEQCKAMCTQIDGPIKTNYLKFFKGISESSQQYAKVIATQNISRATPPVADNLSQSFTTKIYRYYSRDHGDHFYTIDHKEATVQSLLRGYVYEGVEACCSPVWQPGLMLLLRYYNERSIDHFYTTDRSPEYLAGYKYEGDLGYISSGPQCGLVPLYRYFNGGIGDHFYTCNFRELGYGRNGYAYEGVVGYVLTVDPK